MSETETAAETTAEEAPVVDAPEAAAPADEATEAAPTDDVRSALDDGEDAPAETETADEPAADEGETEQPAEDYSTLVTPEGVEADESYLDSTREWAAEKGLTAEVAQAVIDRDVERHKAALAASDEQNAKWEADLKADPDIGGTKYHASMAAANRFLTKWFGEEFASAFKASSDRNNPQILKPLAKLGLFDSEARSFVDSTPAPTLDPNSWEARFGTPDPSKPRSAVAAT